MQRLFLRFGVAAPIIYFGALLVAPFFYPGYSHVRQYASELGAAAAPHPEIFNLAAIACGLSAVLGGIGIGLALVRLYGARITGPLTGVCLAAFGVATIMAGLFPMPNGLHGGFGLGMGMQLAPLFALLAVRKAPGQGGLKLFLLVVLVLSVALFAVMMGAIGPLRRAHIGLWQRTFSVVSIPWMGVLAWALLRVSPRDRPIAA